MSESIDVLWPPFGLKITSGPLALSPVCDADFPELVALAQAGIHAPEEMPFYFPWTAGTAHEVQMRLIQYHWAQRAAMSPASWSLETAVRFDGELVGCQSISTKDYLVTKTGETGSWLGRKYHGRGIGTAMRQTMCAFMFDHLDAEELSSGAFADNPASLAVSRKVGYRENGVFRLKRRDGEMAMNQKLVLTAETLNRPKDDLKVEGVPQLRAFLGLT